MSDFEFFNPSEGGESYDPAAFERFKENLKKSAAAMAAVRKGEQKQKKKEDRLAKILLKFIQSNQQSGVLFLAAKLLEENVPASFILSIVLLGNEGIIGELKREIAMEQLAAPHESEPDGAPPVASEFSLLPRFAGASAVPLALKAEIESWGRGMFEAAEGMPFRLLETALDKEGNIKNVIIDCAANVLREFVEREMPSMDYETYASFCAFLLRGIMTHIKKQIEDQKKIA